ncbi:MAG: TerD family protein [Oscillospiraceae bacterium]|jgi:stress response protein SCP2|nr:TerD family protein [Oscillospiraceae bacterium]
MSVILSKGQKVDLTKTAPGLNQIIIGLGWDPVKQKGGFFSAKPPEIDCDASALLLQSGKLLGAQDIVYFGNLQHKSGAIWHTGDNITGDGDGDDEQLIVKLQSIPAEYDRIVFVVNIYQAVQRKQHFGLVQNAFIRIVNGGNNQELLKYNLSENYNGYTSMIFGEVYRHNGEWKFGALGQPTNDPGLAELSRNYQ